MRYMILLFVRVIRWYTFANFYLIWSLVERCTKSYHTASFYTYFPSIHYSDSKTIDKIRFSLDSAECTTLQLSLVKVYATSHVNEWHDIYQHLMEGSGGMAMLKRHYFPNQKIPSLLTNSLKFHNLHLGNIPCRTSPIAIYVEFLNFKHLWLAAGLEANKANLEYIY